MELSKTNKGLIAVSALSVVVFLAFKNIYKKSAQEKRLGDVCKFQMGPDGIVVYDFPSTISSQNTPLPSYKCKQFNRRSRYHI